MVRRPNGEVEELRRLWWSFGLAGGGDFEVASELGDGGSLGSNGGAVAPLWLRWETKEEQEWKCELGG